MQANHLAIAMPVPGRYGGPDRLLFQRVGSLAAIIILEVIAISIWLDNATLQSTGVIALVHDYGAGLVRCAVAFTIVALTFSESTLTECLRPMSLRLADHKVSWQLIAVHLGFLLIFLGLSSLLYQAPSSASSPNALALIWMLAGVATPSAAALALLPLAFWKELFLLTRPFLSFAFVVSVGAYALGTPTRSMWQPLSRGTMAIAYSIVHPFLPDLTVDYSTFRMGVPTFLVEVTAACSGYEGLGLILVFTAGWLWLNRSVWRFPHALVIVPIGIAAIWLANGIRIAALVMIGSLGAPGVALGGFHSQAGWLGFNVIALALCLGARRSPWLLRVPDDARVVSGSASNPTAPLLLPFLTILGAAMVAQLGSAGFEWLYPVRVIASAAVLVYFARTYRTLDWRITPTGVGLGIVAFAIWIGLERLLIGGASGPMPAALAESSPLHRSFWLAFRIVGGVATVPVAEELAFRAFLLRRMVSRDFESVQWQAVTWLAVLLSSLAFGILHGDRWLAGTLAGGVYAVAVLRRGSIGDAVAAHATTNALLVGWVLVGGQWQLW